MINIRLLNIGLVLGVGLMLPVYRHTHQTYQLVKNAKLTGVWAQIPMMIPARADYVDTLQKQAKILGLKLSVQGSIITIQTSDLLPIYKLLHRMTQIPTLRIESFAMKREKRKILTTIIIKVINGSSINRAAHLVEDDGFLKPRFFYVNAATEVDGQKQIWVNGQSYGTSCPWPLYHTFDRQTGAIKKGDLRPRLSLTSGT